MPNASQKEKAPLEEPGTNENTSTPWVQNINALKQSKCEMTNHILYFNWKMRYDIYCETS